MAKGQVRLSHISFAMMLEEMMSGPCTAKHLAEYTGMGHRAMNHFIRVLKDRKLVHIAGWEKDALGRYGVKVWGLGPGRDADRRVKTRQQVNRDYRTKVAREPLKGTPFYGLIASNDVRRRAA